MTFTALHLPMLQSSSSPLCTLVPREAWSSKSAPFLSYGHVSDLHNSLHSRHQWLTHDSALSGRKRRSKKLEGWIVGVGSTRPGPVAAMPVATEVKGRSDWNQVELIVEELREACDTPAELLHQLIDAMVAEMQAGLAVEGGSKDFKMLLTYVDKLPSGNEKGHFYALDLGGTNFRVLRVCFGGKGSPLTDQDYQEVSIPQELMLGTHEELFKFIARKLANFVSSEGEVFHPLPGRKRELGFTFSFPVKQTSIDAGTLIKWTKGFAVEGTAGKDVVQSLNEAMEQEGLDMIVTALVNDTVGTLAVASLGAVKARHEDEEVMISVILGTGSNACYVESIDAIPKWQGSKPRSGQMIVCMEWGGFSSSYLPRTQYDDALDAVSVNPGEQIFEKLLSGMYLGELVRRVLLRLAEETGLFGQNVPPNLLIPCTLGTAHVSAMHQDESPDLKEVGQVLETVLGIKESSLKVRKLVIEICSIITKRAGRLAGAGIVGILKKIGRDGSVGNNHALGRKKKTVVAMDGGLYEHYPIFRQELQAAVVELHQEAAKDVVVELSKDGSGIGAALLAAAHSRYPVSKN